MCSSLSYRMVFTLWKVVFEFVDEKERSNHGEMHIVLR